MANSPHFERFTKEAKQALAFAQDVAKKMQTNYVGTEHILMGILSQENSLGAAILSHFGVSLENVNLVLQTVGRTQPQNRSTSGPSGLSGFAKKVIEDAVKCAHDYGHMFIGTEHLLYAVVCQENTAATVILENMKVKSAEVKQEVTKQFDQMKQSGVQPHLRPGQQGSVNIANPLEFLLSGMQAVLTGQGEKEPYQKQAPQKDGREQTKTPALDYFTVDLIKECREKKLHPMIGREQEIERMIAILQRKTKNNPVLIGEPGVGKTAVVEGLAYAIVNEKVPDHLLDKRILTLSLASVVAGTKYRGEFEERIKQIIDEASSQPNVILFIDEIHTVIGAGAAEGSLDAANILKPALSRGRIQVIGATTLNEYRKHVEADPALERRFQSVMVNEPPDDVAIAMLSGLKEMFEEHHSLLISEEAVQLAVKLSKRYITDRFLPDKAIDLIDEACSLKRMHVHNDTSVVKKLQKELSKILHKKEEAVSNQDYEFAAELRSQELGLISKIDQARAVKIPKDKRETVIADDIARVISSMTGIPATKLLKSDMDKLMQLETLLHKRIIGQEDAVTAVATAIRRSRVGIANQNRPISSFLFMGPTGVGKTELVRAIAAEVYNDENALIKIDMSEFMERHNTSRLIGTTAGYVGYDDGGQLTEMIRRKPYSVVLFDEIEKAHPDVLNLLLQVLEDGVITDGKGRKIDFRNTVIVMTSNIGAHQLTEKAGPIGFNLQENELKEAEHAFEEKKEQILDELKDTMRPEFLNRIDKIIVFKPLTHENLTSIVHLLLTDLQKRVSEKKITLDVSPQAIETLARLGYDPDYGARPLRRKIQDLVEDPLAHSLLEEKFKEGDTIKITAKDDIFSFKKITPKKTKKILVEAA